ncbi:unnamed protein product [Adineta steineri]|uniref:Protein-serine/threonine kinase n=1 Tax=Adineta steineri TaxID=433720 RepID=A0A815LC12_9BILA|nr:unnamed protein product [Adineta steineri]CAF1407763.1 unnamed protein product [Adineta steineri]CAF1433362.1 unnamed protein product [Adineta steineri]CAF3895901.1 unnamed protein product [Adineta steineri]
MSFYRYLSSTIKATTNVHSQAPALSGIVKQLSKFSSHDELIEYSQRPIEYCYPNRMIEACSPHHSTPIDLMKTAIDLHEQLLVRLAHCLTHFQSIPFLPGVNPTLLSLHERYLKLFETFAHFPQIKTKEDEKKFLELINIFVVQNNDVIGLLSTGCSEAQKHFKTYKIMKDFLDNVLQIRLSMRLLAEHYLELHKQQKDNSSEWRGAICMNFSPVKAIQQCVNDVSSLCFETYTVVPHVQIENTMNESLPYFPSIIEYILRELLKNSMRAIVECSKASLGNVQNVKQYFEENRDKPLCQIVIASNPIDENFTIAVKDQGGGIDESDEEIFKYMFTGDVMKEEEEEVHMDILADFQERMTQSSKQMYGYGFGLPVCRLYAKFFGGSLTLRQVSRIGVDAYLRLGFIHTNSERIKI